MSSEECTTSLSKKRVPLKALVMLLIFSLGSMSVSGTLLSLKVTDAQRAIGTFVLTASPSTISLAQGMNGTSTVTVYSMQGFAGTVVLTSQVPNGNVAVTFTPSTINVPLGGSATSTAMMQASKTASLGSYNVILTGTGIVGKKILSSSALLVLSVTSTADFGVYANPYSITVAAGSTNSSSIMVSSKNGFTGSVSLSAVMPFGFLGVMGGQNPIVLTSNNQATTSIQVSAVSSTAIGKYNITITGTSGLVIHSCILTVNVVDPAPESLTQLGSSLITPTEITLTLRNAGNTPVTLVSYSVADTSGDRWTLGNWTGPTIMPGSTGQAILLIAASCVSCTYSGVTFGFQQFLAGHTYTVTITTKLNNQFTFTVIA